MLRLTPVLANETGTSDLAVSRDQTDSIIPAFQEAYGTQSDGLPNYTEIEQDGGIQSTIQELSAAASAGGLELPITAYPLSHDHRYNLPVNRTHNLRQDIVRSFNATTTKKDEAVALMIEHNLMTANTTDATGQTPLLAAVSVGNVRMVQELADLGADVNDYGVYTEGKYGQRGGGKPRTSHRTALQLAAALGNLNLVNLFVDAYGADDALVAPDGELALRLARSLTSSRSGAEAAGGAGRPGTLKPWIAPGGPRRRYITSAGISCGRRRDSSSVRCRRSAPRASSMLQCGRGNS